MLKPGLIFLGVLSILFTVSVSRSGSTNLDLGKYAGIAVKICSSSTKHPDCYEQEVPKIVKDLSLSDQFKVVSLIQAKDASYTYCHVLGHTLGTAAIRKNRSDWEKVAASCTSGSCSNGCIHGALQEKFDADALNGTQLNALIPDLTSICQDRPGWQPTENERTGCYHALGHTTVYLTKAVVPDSITLCEKISANFVTAHSYQQNCLEGLFMQIFQPLEPEDRDLVASVSPDKGKLRAFCDRYMDLAREACYREGWVLFADEIKTPAGLMSYCNQIPGNRAVESCFSKMFFSLMNTFNFDPPKMAQLCLGLTGPWPEKCFADGAARYITAERNFASQAVSMCQLAQEYKLGQLCFDRLVYYSTNVYRSGSSELKDFCQRLPGLWKDQCLNRN